MPLPVTVLLQIVAGCYERSRSGSDSRVTWLAQVAFNTEAEYRPLFERPVPSGTFRTLARTDYRQYGARSDEAICVIASTKGNYQL